MWPRTDVTCHWKWHSCNHKLITKIVHWLYTGAWSLWTIAHNKCHIYEKNMNWKMAYWNLIGNKQITPSKMIKWGEGMAQWWEHSPSTNVARVRFPDSTSYVGWVCCWFSSLLREVFLRVLRFSPLRKNQHF